MLYGTLRPIDGLPRPLRYAIASARSDRSPSGEAGSESHHESGLRNITFPDR
jgi:hypothetical protein